MDIRNKLNDPVSLKVVYSPVCLLYHAYTSPQMMQWYLTYWGQHKNDRHFADDILKCIFLNENVWISIDISLKCVLKN